MTKISVYIDNNTFKRIKRAAEKEHDSISRWVKKRLVLTMRSSWPKDYFDLFGALKEDTYKRPRQSRIASL